MNNANNFIFIYITNPSEEEARKIAEHLLNIKLIACANIHSVNSIYKWKDKVRNEEEYVLIGKTLEENFDKIKEEVEKIHSYEIPCIIKIPVESNKKYFEWVSREIK